MNIESINLNLLLAFEALLEERSVSRGAKRIGLTQPAMSNALNRLRAIFGDALFVRTARGVVPTARALELERPVRAGLAHLREALADRVAFAPETSTQSFRIAMMDYPEWVMAGPLMKRLQKAAPRMQLIVRQIERIFLPPEDALRDASLDAAVGFFPDASSLQPGTHSFDLWTEDNVCILRRGHPLAKHQSLSLRHFATEFHAANVIRPDAHGFIDDLLAGHGLKRKLAVATPHLLTIPQLVSQTDLIAVVPEGLAERFRKFLPIEVRRVPLRMPLFRTRLLWHERMTENPAHKWLREQIAECTHAFREETN